MKYALLAAALSLAFERTSRTLRAATHGRSVWDLLVLVHGLNLIPLVSSVSPVHLPLNTADLKVTVNGKHFTSASLGLLGQTGMLNFANGRAYAIKSTGGQMTCSGGTCQSSAFEPGWPKKVGIIDRGRLLFQGELSSLKQTRRGSLEDIFLDLIATNQESNA